MNLADLRPAPGAVKKRKRVGRGPGSGHGKTSTRGHKGRKSRSGGSSPPGYEGGQMPLQRRLPKRGFRNPGRRDFAIVNLAQLDSRFEAGATVDPELLVSTGLVSRRGVEVKVLGNGKLSKALTVKAHRFSQSARDAIAAAGGSLEELKRA
jgi:large subunit ribosomal protein L15